MMRSAREAPKVCKIQQVPTSKGRRSPVAAMSSSPIRRSETVARTFAFCFLPFDLLFCFLVSAYGLLPTAFCFGRQPAAVEQDAPLPGDWAPELLDAILSSPNPDASEALYRAAFAAGPGIVPQLEAALKDDRTAEFAAQTLAFIGGGKALEVLAKLVEDPRDLDLRRFCYGALGEFESPEAGQALLKAVKRADAEPDRTVTEAAILALTVRSDMTLIPSLRQAQEKIKDIVIRDDLDNALEVIQMRARYLASPEGKSAGSSVEQAVRSYFIPALEPVSTSAASKSESLPQRSGASNEHAGSAKNTAGASPTVRSESGVKVSTQNLTFSPDKTRALARVVFEDPSAMANYDIVLQKRYGNWTVASVWLGSEVQKPEAAPNPDRSGPKRNPHAKPKPRGSP